MYSNAMVGLSKEVVPLRLRSGNSRGGCIGSQMGLQFVRFLCDKNSIANPTLSHTSDMYS